MKQQTIQTNVMGYPVAIKGNIAILKRGVSEHHFYTTSTRCALAHALQYTFCRMKPMPPLNKNHYQ